MKKACVVVFVSLFCVALTFSGLVFADVGDVGVAEGDWFSYGFSFDFVSDDSNMTVEDVELDYLLEGEFVRFTVLGVSGSNVTGEFSITYKNGTQEVASGWVDVVSGEGKFSSWLISSGLDANDLTYSSDMGELINETVTYATALGSRPTNHIGYTTGNITEEDHYFFEVNMYWDQEIGVLVEMNLEAQTSIDGNVTTASAEWKLLEASNATIPEFSAPVLVAAFIVVTLAAFSVKAYSPKLKK